VIWRLNTNLKRGALTWLGCWNYKDIDKLVRRAVKSSHGISHVISLYITDISGTVSHPIVRIWWDIRFRPPQVFAATDSPTMQFLDKPSDENFSQCIIFILTANTALNQATRQSSKGPNYWMKH
jgi:hypothetical protein